MASSRGESSVALTLALLAFVIASVTLPVVFLPVAKCRFCYGTGLSLWSFDRDAPCEDCLGRGKISLLAKWKQERKVIVEPRLMVR